MVEFGSVSQLFGKEALAPIEERAWPFVDGVGLFAQDGEGAGIQIIGPSPTLVRVHGRSRTAWRRLALHFGIAWRLRRRLERGTAPEALIENGKLVDARGKAKSVRLSEPGLMTRLAVDLAGETIAVLRFDEPSLPAAWQARLTKSQWDVATAAARGLSDSEIARDRGSSIRTVSNLLVATYRILGLDGRADLVRAVVQRDPTSETHRLPDADEEPRLAR